MSEKIKIKIDLLFRSCDRILRAINLPNYKYFNFHNFKDLKIYLPANSFIKVSGVGPFSR